MNSGCFIVGGLCLILSTLKELDDTDMGRGLTKIGWMTIAIGLILSFI